MAGVTLKFSKFSLANTLTQFIVEHASSAAQSVGSWWATVFILLALFYLARVPSWWKGYLLLTYATCLSMIVASPINAMFERELSHRLFKGETKTICEFYLGALGLTLGCGLLSSTFLVLFSNLPLNQKILFITLTSLLTSIWMTTCVLSMLEKEKIIFFSFIAGLGLSFILALILRRYGLPSFLLSLIIGFSLILYSMASYLLKAYKRGRLNVSFGFLKPQHYYWKICSNFFFVFGLWIDKLIFWLFVPAQKYYVFRFSNYDYPFFVAFTIYSLAQWTVFRNLKNWIRNPYDRFIKSLNGNLPLFNIAFEKISFIYGYRRICYHLIFGYGVMVALILLSISTGLIILPWSNPFVFHYLLAGTFFLGIFFLNYLVMQYLCEYRILSTISIAFFLINTSLTFVGIKLGPEFYGVGFFIASLFGSLVTIIFFNPRVARWEYEIFRKTALDF